MGYLFLKNSIKQRQFAFSAFAFYCRIFEHGKRRIRSRQVDADVEVIPGPNPVPRGVCAPAGFSVPPGITALSPRSGEGSFLPGRRESPAGWIGALDPPPLKDPNPGHCERKRIFSPPYEYSYRCPAVGALAPSQPVVVVGEVAVRVVPHKPSRVGYLLTGHRRHINIK